MKRIIYYDSLLIESLVSQFLEGLPKSKKTEEDKSEEKNETIASEQTIISGKFELIKTLFFSAEHKPLENTTENVYSTHKKDTVEMIYNDNMLDILEKHLIEEKRLNNIIYEPYINKTVNAEIYDLDELQELLSISFSEKCLNVYKGTEKITQTQRKSMLNKIGLLNQILPYKHFALTDEYIIPLNKKYLKANPKKYRFMPMNKATLLGIKSKSLYSTVSYAHWDVLGVQSDNINNALKEVFDGKELAIVDPIALYL